MRISLYKKILALFGGTLVFVTAAVLFFAGRNVERAVFDAELKGAENIMRLVNLNLKGQFKGYLTWKVEMITSRKELLREESVMLMSGLDLLSRSGAAGGEKRAVAWLSRVPAGQGRLVFVYDESGRLLCVNDEHYRGASLVGLRDFKGREVASAMRAEAERYGGAYATFNWPVGGLGQRWLGRFAHVSRWGWTLAVCDNLEGMTREVSRRQENILKGLRETMPNVTVARTGPVFLFDGEGRMLVEPEEDLDGLLGGTTGQRGELLGSLAEAARGGNGGGNEIAVVGGLGGDERTVAFVSHFRPLDWYVAAVAPKSELRAPAVDLMRGLAAVMAVALAAGLLVAVGFTRRIVRPLQRLTGHVKGLPERDWTGEDEDMPELEALAGGRRDEVGELADAFLYMDKELRRNIRELMDTVAEKNRIESELGVAREIQMGLLPKIFPPFPEREDVDLHALLEPAREVGGDLYDFFFVDDKTLCVVVGDVSDKGVPAAMFMTIVKTLVKNEALAGRPPEEILLRTNDDLARDNPNAMFVTIFVGLIDVASGEMAFASGGHNPPLLLPAGGEPRFLRDVSGPMVGAMPDMCFRGLSDRLEPGDALLVYTDGVTEAMDPERKMFTEERLLEVATNLGGDDARKLVTGLAEATHRHAGTAPQSDDITILAVRLNASGAGGRSGGES